MDRLSILSQSCYTILCKVYEFSIASQKNIYCLGDRFGHSSTFDGRVFVGAIIFLLTPMGWRAILLRLGGVVLLLGGGFLGYQSYREHERNAKIQGEIDALRAEADKIRRENETLVERIQYFASPDFQEQEAKKKLGMRRQEETVMSIREDPSVHTSLLPPISRAEGDDTLPLDTRANYQKWWSRFFDH